MKHGITMILYNVPALVCFGLSAWLLTHGNQGGWVCFFFAGILLGVVPGKSSAEECQTCR